MDRFVLSKNGSIQEGTPQGVSNTGEIASIIILCNNGDVRQVTPTQLQALIGSGSIIFDSIQVDTITGKTNVNAVTVGGVLLGYGRITTTIPNVYSTVITPIVAYSGGGNAHATVVFKEFNIVTTCAVNYDSVALLPATLGMIQTIINKGVAKLAVYPQAAQSIDDLTPSTGYYTINSGESALFFSANSTNWVSISSQNTNITGITTTGTDYATAVALTKKINNVTLNTAGGGAEGVSLSIAVAGKQQIVFNNSPTTIKVYPITSSYIDGVQNTGVILQVGEMAVFSAIDATHWVSNKVIINVSGSITAGTTMTTGNPATSAQPFKIGSVTPITVSKLTTLGFDSQVNIQLNGIEYYFAGKATTPFV